MTLTDFLLARIAERQASDPQLDVGLERAVWHEVDEALAEKEAFSRQWLADCEVMRRIVDRVAPLASYLLDENDADDSMEGGWSEAVLAADVLAVLATPYADHPDYRKEWKP